MAEALGVASAIVGILSLTIQISQIIVQFGLDWKDAPKEAKALMSELQSLKTILSETQTSLLLNPDFKDAFQNRSSILLSELGPNAPPTTETKLSIANCEHELNHLLDELKKRGNGHRLGWERLKTPFCAKTLQQSIDKVHRQCRSLNDMVSIDSLSVGISVLGEVKHARQEQQAWYDSHDSREVLNWLSELSFAEKQNDTYSKRYPGTGEWFLELDKFKAWRNRSDHFSIMWCTGIPGAGKSVMMSVVIEHLQEMFIDDHVSISYIYCDYKDHKNQTATNLLGSLVKQIVSQHKEMPENVRNLYAKCKGSSSLRDYASLLSSLSNDFRRSFILVDALDEHFINEDHENGLEMTLLDELLQLQYRENALPSFSIFLTSRENLVLQERLEGSVREEIHAADGDIQMYLRSRIYDHTKFRFASKMREAPELAESIMKNLSRKAQGMIQADQIPLKFLLPRLHLDRLSCQTSVRGLRVALNSLPTKLDETYDEAITRIEGQVSEHCELAKLALTWISHALRPLRVSELQHALAVRPEDHDLDPEAIPDIALVVSVCSGLIMIDPESQTVRLVHYTVEEYFKKKRNLFPRADILIAEACMRYLSYYHITKDSFPPGISFGLIAYAAQNWGFHLQGDAERALQDQVLDFLKDDHNLRYTKSFVARNSSYIFRLRVRQSFSNPSRILIIVHFSLQHILSIYLNRIDGSNIEDVPISMGLHQAVTKGIEEVVKILLNQGNIGVNYINERRETPLTIAAKAGNFAIARMLLDRDDVQAGFSDMYDQTPLSHAAEKGHEEIVKILLRRKDVIADSCDNDGQTPLSYAAEKGHEEIVRMLLNRDDVTADSINDYGRTPLSYAAAKGHEGIVRLLLSRNDVAADLVDIDGRTPLVYATKEGHEIIVRILLNRDDVSADRLDVFGRTPLYDAVYRGHRTIVQLLLEREEVKLDQEGLDGNTPFSLARWKGYRDIVLLLEEEMARRGMVERVFCEEEEGEEMQDST